MAKRGSRILLRRFLGKWCGRRSARRQKDGLIVGAAMEIWDCMDIPFHREDAIKEVKAKWEAKQLTCLADWTTCIRHPPEKGDYGYGEELQGAAQECQRAPRERPRAAQERPKSGQERPRRCQETPKSGQKRSQDRPKSSQEKQQTVSRCVFL